jgi:hypothetical protein
LLSTSEITDMTREDFESLRNQGNPRDMFDYVTQNELLQTGLFGSIFGAQVYVSGINLQTTLTSNNENRYKLKYEQKKEPVTFTYNVKLKFIAGEI